MSAARTPRARSVTVPRDEFARRRQHLMKLMGNDSIAVIPAAPLPTITMSNSTVPPASRQGPGQNCNVF